MKNDFTAINALPELVSEKKITLDEAKKRLWSHMYFFPWLYGIQDLNEDQRSEFLLSFSKKFERLILAFDSSFRKTFIGYTKAIVAFAKLSWRRNEFKKIAIADSSAKNYETYFNDKLEDFNSNSQENRIADFSEIPKINAKTASGKKMAKMTAICLLLKACNNVDDSMIKKVSAYSGENEEDLFKKVELMRLKTRRSAEIQQNLIKKIEGAYFSRKRYEIELERTKGSATGEQIFQKFERRKKSWQKNLIAVAKRKTPAPSNDAIGKILNTSASNIARILAKAKESAKKSLETPESKNLKDEN